MTFTSKPSGVLCLLPCLLALSEIASASSESWELPLVTFSSHVQADLTWAEAPIAAGWMQQPDQAEALVWHPLKSNVEGVDASWAQVAVVQTESGLVVYGRVRSDEPQGTWSLHWSTLATLSLEGIGWQRINKFLASDADCQNHDLNAADLAACPGWRATQLKLREQMRQAFKPGWSLAASWGASNPPPIWVAEAGDFSALVPAPPERYTVLDAEGARYFSLSLPWRSWPLAMLGELKRVYLQIRYCTAGECLSASPGTESALELMLPRPLMLQRDPCGQKPTSISGGQLYVRIADRLTFDPSRVVFSAYEFTNPGGGYLDRPDPRRTSPELIEWLSALHELGAGTWLCIPDMRLWRPPQPSVAPTALDSSQRYELEARTWPDPQDWTEHRHPYWRDHEPRFENPNGSTIDATFEERQLADGRRLLIEPYRLDSPEGGEGVNGACDRARFAIWILPANMDGLRRALEISGYGPDLCAGSGLEEVSLADDSRSVTSVRVSQDTDNLTPEQLAQYESGDTIRIRERFCLDDATDTYLRCSMQLSLDRY